MNQSQRNFLIEKIEKLGKIKRDELAKSIPPKPSLSMYILREVMNGNVKIIPNEKIIEIIEDKALKADETNDDWMGTSWSRATKNEIHFLIKDLFILPEDFKKKYNHATQEEKSIREDIRVLLIQEDTLVTRVKLASNSTLETMIKEVDDMGNISLMDTKLKQLTT